MSNANYEFAAHVQDIPVGKTKCIIAADKEILLCHIAEGFFAVDNLCSHAAERLSAGKLKGHKILCPLHGAAFDVRDGCALSRPATLPLRSYGVRVEGDDILINTDSTEEH